MNTQKIKNSFSKKLFQKIEFLISEYEFDIAEKMVKRMLANTSYDNKTRASFYSLLGKIRYLTGQFTAAKRYFNTALKLNPTNFDANYNLANVYMFEQNTKMANKLININLKNHPQNVNILIQLMWSYVLSGHDEKAEIIYKKLLKQKKLEPQSFADLAMAYVSKGNFENAKKVIFVALGNFPDSFIAEDTLYEINELERNYRDYKKDIFFKNIHRINFMPQIYTSALRMIVEGMSLRGYFKFEIEKAAEFLIFLNKEKFEYFNPKLLAAVIEYNISVCIGEDENMRNIILNSYKVSKDKLNKLMQQVNFIAAQKSYELCDEILSEYDEQFGSGEPFGDENE